MARIPRTGRFSLGCAALVFFGSALILDGCGLPLTGSIDTPAGLKASDDLTDMIEVTWNDVTGADIYYVYRALSADDQSLTKGDYGPVPYASVRQPVLLDVDTDPTDYFYRVSAGRLSTNEESALSDAVRGTRVAPEIGWQEPPPIGSSVNGTPGTIRLAIDRTTSTVSAYLLAVGAASGATVNVRRIESDGSLTNLGGPPEPADGSDSRVADLAAARSIYVALVAEDPYVETNRDRVFLFRYDEDLEEWEFLEGPAFAVAHPSAPFVSLDAIGADDLLLAYRGASGQLVTYRYDGSAVSVPPPVSADDIFGAGDPSLGQIDIAAVPGGAALMYELESDTVAGDTDSIGVSLWIADPGVWAAQEVAYDGLNGSVSTGAAVVAIDPTVTPVADAVTVGYLEDTGGFHLVDAMGVVVTGSDAGFSGAVDLSAPSIGLAAQSGSVFLLYRDSVAAAGAIARFSITEETWSQFSPDDFTDTSEPAKMTLAAGGGKLFAAYEDDTLFPGGTQVRAYQ